MASSARQYLEMIEQGQQVLLDPAADGTKAQQAYSEIGRLLDHDFPQRPVLDDIDMTLRRKVSFCGQCAVYRHAGCETMHCSLRAAHDSEYSDISTA